MDREGVLHLMVAPCSRPDAAGWQANVPRLLDMFAALLAGDVDIINAAASTDLARLRADSHLALAEVAGLRIVYLALDAARADSSFVSGPNGEKLDRNPLQDPRVRRALALAIDRRAIADRIMDGAALPTAQVVRPGLTGYDPALQPGHNPAEARSLLAAAGYPRGFRLTLHGPNDRYPNDAAVIQAVGQMWTRVGVQTTVEALPWASLSARASRQAFSAVLLGGTAATNDATYPLRSVVATYDTAAGNGMSNNTRYSNPGFDAVLGRAMHTVDDAGRGTLLRQAMAIAAQDTPIIPLYIQKAAWAMRASLSYAPRVDEATHAAEVHPR